MASFLKDPQNAFEPVRAIEPDGSPLDGDVEIDNENLVKRLEALFADMLRARRFDERMLRLQRQGEIGTFAPVKGQEAAQIGAVACLREGDWLVPSFRETGAALVRGLSMTDILVAAAGWNAGAAMPEGGRTLPNTVPVSSQLPVAVGIALAARRHGDTSVVMVCFGDGATSGGDFHEAMNFAAVLDAPVVFFCQNNGWAISTPRDKQTASESLAQKAHAYGVPAAQVDGNDILAVLQVTEEAISHARDTCRPVMIEAITYRMEVHTTADDPTRYREEGEVEAWRDRDPIERLKAFLFKRSQLDDGMVDSLEAQIAEEIDEAWDAAKARMAELDEGPRAQMFEHVFAELTQPLKRQKDQFERLEKEGLIG